MENHENLSVIGCIVLELEQLKLIIKELEERLKELENVTHEHR